MVAIVNNNATPDTAARPQQLAPEFGNALPRTPFGEGGCTPESSFRSLRNILPAQEQLLQPHKQTHFLPKFCSGSFSDAPGWLPHHRAPRPPPKGTVPVAPPCFLLPSASALFLISTPRVSALHPALIMSLASQPHHTFPSASDLPLRLLILGHLSPLQTDLARQSPSRSHPP